MIAVLETSLTRAILETIARPDRADRRQCRSSSFDLSPTVALLAIDSRLRTPNVGIELKTSTETCVFVGRSTLPEQTYVLNVMVGCTVLALPCNQLNYKETLVVPLKRYP